MRTVKVSFALASQGDGYPPVAAETLNAELVGECMVRLENTPFFADSVAMEDVLLCSATENPGLFDFVEVKKIGGRKALSVIFLDDSVKESLYAFLAGQGCYCEYGEFGNFSMLAISVPKGAEYKVILNRLDEEEQVERISYAELCL